MLWRRFIKTSTDGIIVGNGKLVVSSELDVKLKAVAVVHSLLERCERVLRDSHVVKQPAMRKVERLAHRLECRLLPLAHRTRPGLQQRQNKCPERPHKAHHAKNHPKKHRHRFNHSLTHKKKTHNKKPELRDVFHMKSAFEV